MYETLTDVCYSCLVAHRCLNTKLHTQHAGCPKVYFTSMQIIVFLSVFPGRVLIHTQNTEITFCHGFGSFTNWETV